MHDPSSCTYSYGYLSAFNNRLTTLLEASLRVKLNNTVQPKKRLAAYRLILASSVTKAKPGGWCWLANVSNILSLSTRQTSGNHYSFIARASLTVFPRYFLTCTLFLVRPPWFSSLLSFHCLAQLPVKATVVSLLIKSQ